MTGQSLRSPCIRPSTCTADAHRGSEVRHLYRRVGRRVDPRGPTCFRARAQEQRPPMRVQLFRYTRIRPTIAPPSVRIVSILPDAKCPLRNSRCATRAGQRIGAQKIGTGTHGALLFAKNQITLLHRTLCGQRGNVLSCPRSSKQEHHAYIRVRQD